MKAIFVGGKYNGLIVDEKDLEKMPSRGRSYDWSRERAWGGVVPRAELDNRPLIEGYLSPMYDGGMLRYETQEAYDILSM